MSRDPMGSHLCPQNVAAWMDKLALPLPQPMLEEEEQEETLW